MRRLPSGDKARVVKPEKFVAGGITETQSGVSVDFRKNRRTVRIAARIAIAAAPSAIVVHRLAAGVAVVGSGAPARTHSSASIKSAEDCHRLFGSFARHFRTIFSSSGGVRGTSDEIERGSCSRIAAIRLTWLFPSKAFEPVTIS